MYDLQAHRRQSSGTVATSRKGSVLVRIEKAERVYRLGGQRIHAVQGVDLNVHKGEFVVLRGRSGSGKTTLLNLIGGLDRPTGGRVLYMDKDLSTYSERELTRWRRREIGLIFQAVALLPALTALENVELPLRIAGTPTGEATARSREWLARVGLGKRMHHRSFELSGGEQQRVAVARAMVTNPNLVLADEPTGELDQSTGVHILNLFRDIVDTEGTTFCMVTHDPGASAFGDVTYLMDDGKLTLAQREEGAEK